MIHTEGKSVRFAPDESICECHAGPKLLSQDSICDQWLQQDEYDTIREDCRKTIFDTRNDSSYCGISQVFGFPNHATQLVLNQWSVSHSSCRGLEQFVDTNYSETRIELRNHYVRAIMCTQEHLSQQGEFQYDRRSEIIRNVSIMLSKESVDFSIMLGRADENALNAHQHIGCGSSKLIIPAPVRHSPVSPKVASLDGHTPLSLKVAIFAVLKTLLC